MEQACVNTVHLYLVPVHQQGLPLKKKYTFALKSTDSLKFLSKHYTQPPKVQLLTIP